MHEKAHFTRLAAHANGQNVIKERHKCNRKPKSKAGPPVTTRAGHAGHLMLLLILVTALLKCH